MARNQNQLPRGTRTKGGVRTNNRWEHSIATQLEEQGYEVVRNGWPDLLAVKDGEVRFIEVKPPGNEAGLSPRQKKVARMLAPLGVEVELAKGDQLP